jgi:glycosyltransferase involved in cell wall biosynthesis
VKFCDEIICVSNSTKKDLITYTNMNENKISVIHLGRDEFIPNITREQIVNTCNKYNIRSSKKYILFIGTLEPRKNISTILKTFNSFQKEISNYQLVIVGGKGWYYDDLFKLANSINSQDIVFTGYIDELEKWIFLAGADFFVYPSFYEGFGVPILEALSFSLPTITSNLSSMPEVAGDAALLIDPISEEEMLSAFFKFATDQKLRDSLVSKCQSQVEKFSWRKMTQSTINIYNSNN